MQHLVPSIVQLLKDNSTEVRVSLIKNLNYLTKVIGSEEFDNTLVPAILELSESKVWRVRNAFLELIPLLSEIL